RFSRDWSSDVCSSDLDEPTGTRSDIQHYASMLRKAIQETFSDLDLREPFATGTVGVFRIGWGWLVFFGGAAFKYLFLTPFFFFFWSISLGSVKQFGAQLIPDKHRARSLVVIRKMDRAIAAFIRGRLTI